MGKKKQKKKLDEKSATPEIVEVVELNIVNRPKRQSAFSLYTTKSKSEGTSARKDMKTKKDDGVGPGMLQRKRIISSENVDGEKMQNKMGKKRVRRLSEDCLQEKKVKSLCRSGSGSWKVTALPQKNINSEEKQPNMEKRKQENEPTSKEKKRKLETEEKNVKDSMPSDGSLELFVPNETSVPLNSSKPSTHHEEHEKLEQGEGSGIFTEADITLDKNVKPESNFRSFDLGKPGFTAIVLQHPGQLTVWGFARVKSLYGSIDIYGYHLSQASAAVNIYSPNTSNFLSFKTCPHEGHIDQNLIHNSLKEVSSNFKKISKEIQQCLTKSSVLLLIEDIKESQTKLGLMKVNMSPFRKVFPSRSDAWEQKNPGFSKIGTVQLVAVDSCPDDPVMKFPPQMQEAADVFTSEILAGNNPVVVTCGGKSMGKSSLSRFLMNSALRYCRQVAYLECDIGQTEFTPPGSVALHMVCEPVIGPPFTHQHLTAQRMVYVGGVSPADDPAHYLKCLRYVHSAYTSLSTACPIVVNTMGWNKDLGLSLLAETLEMVKPDLVLQLCDDSKYRNMAPVTAEFVKTTLRWPNQFPEEDLESYSHKLIRLNSALNQMDNRLSMNKCTPLSHRALALLGYLGRCKGDPGPHHPLHSLTPQTIPWSQVAVHVSNCRVPNSQVLYVLNGSVVALCKVDQQKICEPEDKTLPRFLSATPVCDCLGYGVVRAINPVKKLFHILSPVTLDGSTDVNCLMYGGLALPEHVVTNQPSVNGHIPYIDDMKSIVGSSSVRPRTHTFRRKK